MPNKNLSILGYTDLLAKHCKDIDEWPEGWEIDEGDIKIGHDIVEQFRPFIVSLIDRDLSKKSIKIYKNYLWVLGGELIRQINEDESERLLSAEELILKHVNEGGGPYWCHANDELDYAKYNSVCKRLFSFITEKLGNLPEGYLN